jgi:hypothetical protein
MVFSQKFKLGIFPDYERFMKTVNKYVKSKSIKGRQSDP